MSKSEQFRAWYDKNKHEFNGRRRDRYAADDDFAEKERKRLRQWRKTHPRPKPDGRKYADGVEVFSIAKVARLFAVTTGFIRGMERKGLIPVPTVKLATRHYTRTQVVSMGPLIAHWRDNKGRYRAAGVIEDALDLANVAKKEWLHGDVDEE